MGDCNEVKFRTEKDEKVGRYAVADCDLKAGDVIFSEKPFAFGPKPDTFPLCLGCYTAVDCSVTCSKCGWPVCSPECENNPAHSRAECEVFSKANVKFQPIENPADVCLQYDCITPLRVLLAKEADPKRWDEEIAPMEAHNDVRKNKPVWEMNKTNVVDYLRGPCKLQDRFSEDLIHTVCGILEVNAFEARSISGYPIRCLYPKLAILSHNCVSNITHSIDMTGSGDADDFKVTVRAAVDLKKDAQLYSSYTYSLWPTLVRREFLKESKYFECTCERCSDPTELGTHSGTLKCNKCDNGVIISTDALDSAAIWKCTHCEFQTKGDAVRKVYAAIQADIDSVEMLEPSPEAIEQREQLFRKYRSVLHPKNSYMNILRTALSQLYGKVEGYTLQDLPDILHERKVEFCKDLLSVLDVIEPGHSRIRGLTLYELHAPLIFLARNLFNTGVINKSELREKLEESIKYLEEATAILTKEPPSTPEGALGQVAQQSLQQLKENIDSLVENA